MQDMSVSGSLFAMSILRLMSKQTKDDKFESCKHTFINTDSLSFSRLTIFMATFWHVTQWTPSFTSPEKKKERQKSISETDHYSSGFM